MTDSHTFACIDSSQEIRNSIVFQDREAKPILLVRFDPPRIEVPDGVEINQAAREVLRIVESQLHRVSPSRFSSALPDDTICLFTDGPAWFAVRPDYANIMESVYGCGDNPAEAVEHLRVKETATARSTEQLMIVPLTPMRRRPLPAASFRATLLAAGVTVPADPEEEFDTPIVVERETDAERTR